uniref:Guanine nucleotide-binding protein subunit gamma n=1 Tax=Monodelphis domestica TaxID=13616 RepID=A0A5F8GIJ2_MONDO
LLKKSSVNALKRNLAKQRKLEAWMERTTISQAASELQKYCMQNACRDVLLVGVPEENNPFLGPSSSI